MTELFPTPRASEGEKGGPNMRGSKGDLMLSSAVTHLLATPTAQEDGSASNLEARDIRVAAAKAKHGRIFGETLAVQLAKLLPTTTAQDANASGGSDPGNVTLTDAVTGRRGLEPGVVNFGQYEPAVRRWEGLTRPAPAPTLPDGKGDNHRLNAAFAEWMMGLPAGWVTDVGLTRREALKACGNGVVPQQAYAALEGMWSRVTEAVPA